MVYLATCFLQFTTSDFLSGICRMNREARFLTIVTLLALSTAMAACHHDCERLATTSITSPDGKWLAIAHGDGCGGGFGTGWAGVTVELAYANGSQKPFGILSPVGDWSPYSLPKLAWVSQDKLQVTVPNRNSVDHLGPAVRGCRGH
jgi:hypothetical protein